MQNRDRVLAEVDEIQGYLKEPRQIRPSSYEEYSTSIEKRRSTERLLQISIECVLDTCSLVASALRLGLPSSEEDLLEKIESADIFQHATMRKIKAMRAFRNILVHRYGRVDDHIVFDAITKQLTDFDTFIEETLQLTNRLER
jgi:uncharacterized protein YutE (UPF0331/DUF86 family)